MEPTQEKYELWYSETDGYTFFATSNNDARCLVLPDATLVWTVEAIDFFDAQSKKHAFLGWEPYSPPIGL